MHKTLISALSIVLAAAAEAASPLATQAWVRQLLSDSGYSSSVVTKAEETTTELSEEISGQLPFSNETVTASVRLYTPTNNLTMVIHASSVATLPAGSVLDWNLSARQFGATSLPSVSFEAVRTLTVSTNVVGQIIAVTNRTDAYSAATGGTNYHSTVHQGRRYLVGPLGMSGPKCEYYLQRTASAASAASAVLTLAAGPRLAAAQPTYDEPQEGIYSGVEIGEITWVKNGHTYTFTGGYTGAFTLDGYTSIYDYVGNVLALFEAGNDNAIVNGLDYLTAAVGDPTNWGLFTDGSGKMSGTDGRNITLTAFTDSEFWKDLVSKTTLWLTAEYARIIQLYFDNASKHNCPYKKDGDWTPADDCKCQFTWKGQDGKINNCVWSTFSQHQWANFVAVGHSLQLSDVGCTLCARCHQADPASGAFHYMVPDTDDYDYCGCYCRYYYQKKKKTSETDTDSVESADTVVTDTKYKTEEIGGFEFQVPVKYIAATNLNELDEDDNQWTHYRRTVTDPWGEACQVVTSRAAKAAEEEDEDESWHCDPVTDPMECTCKCGLHHTFKPSPCPLICRGCNSHANAYNNYLSTNSAPAECHTAFENGKWDIVEYTDEDGEDQTWDPREDGPYASWYGSVTNGTSGCGCACGKRQTSRTGTDGVWGDYGTFHCYADHPTSEIQDGFTKWFVENKLGLDKVPYCKCNNYDWEKANGKLIGNGRNNCGSATCRDVCMFHGVKHNKNSDDESWNRHTGIMQFDNVMMTDWILGTRVISSKEIYPAFIEHGNDGSGFAIDRCGCLCGTVVPLTATQHGMASWPGATSANWHGIDFASTNCICLCGHYHACITDDYLDLVDPDRQLYSLEGRTACPGICAFCGYYNESGPTGTIERASVYDHTPDSSHCSCQCHRESRMPKRFKNKSGTLVRGYSAEDDRFEYPNNTVEKSDGYSKERTEVAKWHHTLDSEHHYCIGCGLDDDKILYHIPYFGNACSNVCKKVVGNLRTDICGHAEPYYTKDKSGNLQDNLGSHIHTQGGEYCGCDCGYQLYNNEGLVAHYCQTNECYCFGTIASCEYHQNEQIHVPTESNPEGKALIEHLGPIENVFKTNVTKSCSLCGASLHMTVITNQCQNCEELIPNEISEEHHCQSECCACCEDCGKCKCSYCLYRIGSTCTCSHSTDGGRTLKYTDTNVTEGQYADDQAGNEKAETVDGSDPVLTVARRGFAGAWSNCVRLVSANFSATTEAGEEAFAWAFAGDASLKYARFPKIEYASDGLFKGAFKGCSKLELLDCSRMTINGTSGVFDGNDGCTSTNLVIKLSSSAGAFTYEQTLPQMFTGISEIHFYSSDDTGEVDPQSPMSFYVGSGSTTKIYVPSKSLADWKADSEWSSYADKIFAEPE